MNVTWQGVFPAATTQFRRDQSLDLIATAQHLEVMIEAGIVANSGTFSDLYELAMQAGPTL